MPVSLNYVCLIVNQITPPETRDADTWRNGPQLKTEFPMHAEDFLLLVGTSFSRLDLDGAPCVKSTSDPRSY